MFFSLKRPRRLIRPTERPPSQPLTDNLEEDVKKNPDIPLKERAQKFGVTSSSLCYRFKKMKITRKKNNFAIKKEITVKEQNTIES